MKKYYCITIIPVILLLSCLIFKYSNHKWLSLESELWKDIYAMTNWWIEIIMMPNDGNNIIYKLYNNTDSYVFNFYKNYISILNGDKWIKIIDSNENGCHINNKPTAFSFYEWNLILSVLDTCWWWSMDWTLSTFKLLNNWTFDLVWCYDYSNWSLFESVATEEEKENGIWYINWTTKFDKLESLPLKICKNNIYIEYYH